MKVNLFVLIPELNPQFEWIKNLDDFIEEQNIIYFLNNISNSKKELNLENYTGFYDNENLSNLINQVSILEDSYPKPILRTLRFLFKEFYDWRDSTTISAENSYSIFGQNIRNHTLCEIAQRKKNIPSENFVLLSNQVVLFNEILVTINQSTQITLEFLENNIDILNWFSENRIPKRNFQSIQKHNIQEPIIRNNKLISPLYGTQEDASNILNSAIGLNSKELFGFDVLFQKVILFKFENNTPQNQYHGYHVDVNSDEIPNEIKIKLNIL